MIAAPKACAGVALAVLAISGTLSTLRAQTNPTLDLAFKPVFTRAGGFASSLVVRPDGLLVVSGAFNAVNGVPRNGLARLNADGSVDPSFDAGIVCCGTANVGSDISTPVTTMALQPDGKIVIAGPFTSINGVSRAGMARLNADGTLDKSFDVGTGFAFRSAAPSILSIIVQPDNRLLVGGAFTTVNGAAHSGIVRLNADGSVDPSLDAGAGFPNGDASDTGQLAAMVLLSNGQVLVGGFFTTVNGTPRNGIARLNVDGTVDPAFNPDLNIETGTPSVSGIIVQADGRIAISGSFDVSNNELRPGLARLKPNGALDTGFNPNIDPSVESYTLLAQASDGEVLAFHTFSDASGTAHRAIARMDANGTPDPAFDVELFPGEGNRFKLGGVALAPGGNWYVAGNLAADASGGHQGLFRFTSAGALDAAFNPQFELAEAFANVTTLAVQPDDRVLVGGSYDRINGVARPFLARLNRDGTLDGSFAPTLQAGDVRSAVTTLLVDPNGNVLVGGTLTNVSGVARDGLARLKTDGTVDMSFDTGSGAGGGGVTALAVQPDGNVLVAGGFSDFNGSGKSFLVRLTTSGAVDPGFSPDFPSDCAFCTVPQITSLGVVSNGVVMVGGSFTKVEAVFVNGLVRLRANGTADLTTPLPPIGADEQVSAMLVDHDLKTIVAVSAPDTAGGGSHTRLLRINSDGTADTDFKGPDFQGGSVSAMALDSGSRIVLAGDFSTAGGQSRHGLARLLSDGTLDPAFDPGTGIESAVFASRSSGSLVKTVGLQQDGGVLVGGSFAQANAQPRLGLARYQTDVATGGSGGGAKLGGPSIAADGTVTLQLTGDAGTSYQVQASPDLHTWTTVTTVTGTGAAQSVTDPGAKGVARRFYRALTQ